MYLIKFSKLIWHEYNKYLVNPLQFTSKLVFSNFFIYQGGFVTETSHLELPPARDSPFRSITTLTPR